MKEVIFDSFRTLIIVFFGEISKFGHVEFFMEVRLYFISKFISQSFYRWERYALKSENVECFKYLRILLDCKLNFHQHIDKVKNKILQFCGVFFQLRKFLTGQQLIFAYKSYVQPIIRYGVLVNANTDKTKLLELEMKIRRLIRIIFINTGWIQSLK